MLYINSLGELLKNKDKIKYIQKAFSQLTINNLSNAKITYNQIIKRLVNVQKIRSKKKLG